MENTFSTRAQQTQEPENAQGEPGCMIVFDLRQLARFQEDKPYVQVLSDLESARLILFTFKAGQQLKEHQAPSQILLQVLRGRVTFTTAGSSVLLQAGKVLQLEANIPHSVHARTDAVMLLTMTPSPAASNGGQEFLRDLTPLVTRVTNN